MRHPPEVNAEADHEGREGHESAANTGRNSPLPARAADLQKVPDLKEAQQLLEQLNDTSACEGGSLLLGNGLLDKPEIQSLLQELEAATGRVCVIDEIVVAGARGCTTA